MYAAGTDSAQKAHCISILKKIIHGDIDAAASAEVLQEILHRYRAIHRFEDGMKVYDAFRALPIRWLEILPEDVDESKSLLQSHTHLSSRDALHVSVMQRNKIKRIATFDQGFLGVSSISVFLP